MLNKLFLFLIFGLSSCSISEADLDKILSISQENIHDDLERKASKYCLTGFVIKNKKDTTRFELYKINYVKYLFEYKNDSIISFSTNDNDYEKFNSSDLIPFATKFNKIYYAFIGGYWELSSWNVDYIKNNSNYFNDSIIRIRYEFSKEVGCPDTPFLEFNSYNEKITKLSHCMGSYYFLLYSKYRDYDVPCVVEYSDLHSSYTYNLTHVLVDTEVTLPFQWQNIVSKKGNVSNEVIGK